MPTAKLCLLGGYCYPHNLAHRPLILLDSTDYAPISTNLNISFEVKMIRKFFPILLVFTAFSSSSCIAPMLIGAGAGAGIDAYINGEYKHIASSPIEKSFDVTRTTLKELEIKVESASLEGEEGEIKGRFSNDDKVQIVLKKFNEHATEFKVRVGLIGEDARSRYLMEKIEANLDKTGGTEPKPSQQVVAPKAPVEAVQEQPVEATKQKEAESVKPAKAPEPKAPEKPAIKPADDPDSPWYNPVPIL